MSAIAWTTIENAILAWVMAASGLPERLIRWEWQRGERPAETYIVLQIDDVMKVGRDWKVVDDAPVPVAGAELRVRSFGHRVGTLRMQCFLGRGDTADLTVKILVDVVSELEAHVYDLDLNGVGIGDVSPVRLAVGGRKTTLDARSIVEFGLHFGSVAESRSTYIERMQVTVNGSELWVPDPPPPES